MSQSRVKMSAYAAEQAALDDRYASALRASPSDGQKGKVQAYQITQSSPQAASSAKGANIHPFPNALASVNLAPQPEAPKVAHRVSGDFVEKQIDNEVSSFLMLVIVTIAVLAVAAVIGLFLMRPIDVAPEKTVFDHTIAKQPDGLGVGLVSTQPSRMQQVIRKNLKLEEQNRHLQRVLVAEREKNADMVSALSELKTLYSSLRIESSWALAKRDLENSAPVQIANSSPNPRIYLDIPLSSDLNMVEENQFVSFKDELKNDLSFTVKAKVNNTETAAVYSPTNAESKSKSSVSDGSLKVASLNSDSLGSPAFANKKSELADKLVAGIGTETRSIARQAPEALVALGILRMPQTKPADIAIQAAKDRESRLAYNATSGDFEPLPDVNGFSGVPSARTSAFLDKMRKLKAGQLSEPITILHIGDSHIASDALSRGIRRRLQSLYGDAGRGAVVPAKAYKFAVADGVKLTGSRGWSSANSLRVKSGPYGLSGVRVATSSPGAKLTMTSRSGSFDWAEVTLYVGPGQGRVTIATAAGSKEVSARASAPGSKTVRVEGRSKNLTVTHNGGGKTTVLNWSTGKKQPGIRYVNFGIAGATVAITKRWSDNLLLNDIKRIDPDLIIYGYGTNEGYNSRLNLASYEKMADKFLATIQRASPNAALMFFGPADGAQRRASNYSCGGGWYTPNKLGPLRSTLKSMAAKHSALYWDWASAMGGRCGVTKWAVQSPRLASKDRIHLTMKGYDRSAGAFVDYLERQVTKSLKIAAN